MTCAAAMRPADGCQNQFVLPLHLGCRMKGGVLRSRPWRHCFLGLGSCEQGRGRRDQLNVLLSTTDASGTRSSPDLSSRAVPRVADAEGVTRFRRQFPLQVAARVLRIRAVAQARAARAREDPRLAPLPHHSPTLRQHLDRTRGYSQSRDDCCLLRISVVGSDGPRCCSTRHGRPAGRGARSSRSSAASSRL